MTINGINGTNAQITGYQWRRKSCLCGLQWRKWETDNSILEQRCGHSDYYF